MKARSRFYLFSFLWIAAYVLAACGAQPARPAQSAQGPRTATNPVAFSGVVEAIDGSQWTVGGQTFSLAPQAALDPDIAVGDEVKVEASVSPDGEVVATKIESPAREAAGASVAVQASSTASPDSSPTPEVVSTPQAGSTPVLAPTQAPGAAESEIFGLVAAITADTITVNGVTYNLVGSTVIKDILAVGDPVKLHVIVQADGTVTVREVQKSVTSAGDNSNVSDDGSSHDLHDDHSDDNTNGSHDGSDDHGSDDHDSGHE